MFFINYILSKGLPFIYLIPKLFYTIYYNLNLTYKYIMIEYVQKRGKHMNDLNSNNEKLAHLFEQLHINSFYLTGAGNSLMSGYSSIFKTIPLFKRNKNLCAIFEAHQINAIINHFSRTQNNNDEHTYQYFCDNISEEQIYQYNRSDVITQNSVMTAQDLEEYYPKTPKQNYKFKDLILRTNPHEANVLVYIGATGSFLDNLTRNGSFKNINGFKRDLISISALLKTIQISNRSKNAKTQVYLVGIPKYLKLPITDIFINNHLKKLATQYANVKYVDPINAKLFYGHKVDIHLNDQEYLELNNSIMDSIINNYLIVDAKITIDRTLFQLNQIIEMDLKNKEQAFNLLNQYLNPIIDEYIAKINNLGLNPIQFIQDISAYINERFPYDFYSLGKNNIKKVVKHGKS